MDTGLTRRAGRSPRRIPRGPEGAGWGRRLSRRLAPGASLFVVFVLFASIIFLMFFWIDFWSLLGSFGAPPGGHVGHFGRPRGAKLGLKPVLEAHLVEKCRFSTFCKSPQRKAQFWLPKPSRWRPKRPKIAPRGPQEGLGRRFFRS